MNTANISVVIATRNRVEPLRTTLSTLRDQTLLPMEALIVDSSDTDETKQLVESLRPETPFQFRYVPAAVRSAARQRNLGADQAAGDLLVFMDDDVRLFPQFLEELARPFREDRDGRLAGVSGTIINQTYSQPKGLNRLLLAFCLGNFDSCWAGRLVGPAVNFLPQDKPDTCQLVEWLFSGGTAYRKDIFQRYRFGEQFTGYSFAEDVHLSARIARDYRLCNTSRARFEHMDLGGSTHTDWAALGESMIANRRLIMVDVLGRTRLRDMMHLFAYEVGYCSLAMVAQSRFHPRQMARIGLLLVGKLRAFGKMLITPSRSRTVASVGSSLR
jgi:glycosyltransferase involved in cell wall biosynthesis